MSTDSINRQKNQIFKKPISINIFLDLLKDYFEENKSFIKINNIMFNKMQYNDKLGMFKDSIREYYHTSKLKYVDRVIKYKEFLTIIRQLCKANNIKYESKNVYNNSGYEIEYIIYTTRSV